MSEPRLFNCFTHGNPVRVLGPDTLGLRLPLLCDVRRCRANFPERVGRALHLRFDKVRVEIRRPGTTRFEGDQGNQGANHPSAGTAGCRRRQTFPSLCLCIFVIEWGYSKAKSSSSGHASSRHVSPSLPSSSLFTSRRRNWLLRY